MFVGLLLLLFLLLHFAMYFHCLHCYLEKEKKDMALTIYYAFNSSIFSHIYLSLYIIHNIFIGSIGTRLNLHAGYDINTHQCSARLGFRSENTIKLSTTGTSSSMVSYDTTNNNGQRGFTIVPIIPLDILNNAKRRKILLESRIRITLPEPEFVIGTDFFQQGSSSNSRRSSGQASTSSTTSSSTSSTTSIGEGDCTTSVLEMGIRGDVNVDIEQINLIVHL
jgi:hypothetical protein